MDSFKLSHSETGSTIHCAAGRRQSYSFHHRQRKPSQYWRQGWTKQIFKRNCLSLTSCSPRRSDQTYHRCSFVGETLEVACPAWVCSLSMCQGDSGRDSCIDCVLSTVACSWWMTGAVSCYLNSLTSVWLTDREERGSERRYKGLDHRPGARDHPVAFPLELRKSLRSNSIVLRHRWGSDLGGRDLISLTEWLRMKGWGGEM